MQVEKSKNVCLIITRELMGRKGELTQIFRHSMKDIIPEIDQK